MYITSFLNKMHSKNKVLVRNINIYILYSIYYEILQFTRLSFYIKLHESNFPLKTTKCTLALNIFNCESTAVFLSFLAHILS